MRYRKKITEFVEATRWFKNGDHPGDGCESFVGDDGKTYQTEGKVVRFYRHPREDGDSPCNRCGVRMHDHGWIDVPPHGKKVCPGCWVVATNAWCDLEVMSDDLFSMAYEPADK